MFRPTNELKKIKKNENKQKTKFQTSKYHPGNREKSILWYKNSLTHTHTQVNILVQAVGSGLIMGIHLRCHVAGDERPERAWNCGKGFSELQFARGKISQFSFFFFRK